MTGLYVLGVVIAIVMALLFKNTIFKGEAVPFVMELPNYRMPSAGNVLRLMWEKARDFLTRAFSVILVATVVVWFLQSFDTHMNFTEDQSTSIMAMIAGFIVPAFEPLGLADWRIITSLISGFMAKESVVATLGILFKEGIGQALNAVSAGTGNVSAGTSIFSMVVLDKPLSKYYPEIDIVTTPTGKPVAMVHCNNCTNDMNAWIGMLKENAALFGAEPDTGEEPEAAEPEQEEPEEIEFEFSVEDDKDGA